MQWEWSRLEQLLSSVGSLGHKLSSHLFLWPLLELWATLVEKVIFIKRFKEELQKDVKKKPGDTDRDRGLVIL